ncbi:MAG: AAA family ATPase, partial [Nitrosarchaeum sp.]|nr:AAA family ATPase [Nitrosarchaeum sp.]
MSQNALSLKVLEAYTRDVGRGVARIDYDSMDTLNASTGDVIEIKGKRRTVAKCLPLYPSDEGKGIIRIDGLGRNNSGIAIGDTITVRKIKAVAAEKVVVAPLEAIPPIDERYLADALESVPLIKGDNVMVPYFGGRLTFQVIGVTPAADAVLVTQKTVFHIAEKGETLRGVPQVTYEDIGGLTDEIKKVREMIELPLRHPEIFEKLGIEAPKGVLLYGPPGTGKTLLAKAVANESQAHFISISGPEIMSKFYGESEARLREIFKEAREKAPSIIFVDEIDSIAPKREEVTGEVERRVVSQMLSLMDGLEARGKVIVIAATNRPNAIDPALRRPGRFDREIEIKVPDKKGRKDILAIHSRNMPLSDDVNVEKISSVSHGYVGADLEYLCKEAAMKCLRRLLPELNMEEEKLPPETLDKLIVNNDDFQKALIEVTPSGMREVFIENPDVKW